MKDIFDLILEISIRVGILSALDKIPNIEESYKKISMNNVAFPNSLMLSMDQAKILGSDATDCLVRLHIEVEHFNRLQSAEERLLHANGALGKAIKSMNDVIFASKIVK